MKELCTFLGALLIVFLVLIVIIGALAFVWSAYLIRKEEKEANQIKSNILNGKE